MKLCDFGFLADENVHPEVVTFLGEHGRDVRAAGELGLLGAADAAIMKVAASERRVVVTHDGDFGRLAIAAGEPFVGILYLRPGHVAPAFTIRGIEELLAADFEVSSPFIIVVRRRGRRIRIRVRRPT